jgi:hypothetical protein
MPRFKKLKEGQVFGELTVVRYTGRDARRNSEYYCVCSCGKGVTVRRSYLVRGHTRSCGHLVHRRGNKSPSWKGGRTLDRCHGYVLIQKRGHPKSQGGYVREHVLVMEQFLGRYLTDDETVHHKNGVRFDNRLNNLELWSGNHPKGQRISDLVVWAKEILAKYNNVKARG